MPPDPVRLRRGSGKRHGPYGTAARSGWPRDGAPAAPTPSAAPAHTRPPTTFGPRYTRPIAAGAGKRRQRAGPTRPSRHRHLSPDWRTGNQRKQQPGLTSLSSRMWVRIHLEQQDRWPAMTDKRLRAPQVQSGPLSIRIALLGSVVDGRTARHRPLKSAALPLS